MELVTISSFYCKDILERYFKITGRKEELSTYKCEKVTNCKIGNDDEYYKLFITTKSSITLNFFMKVRPLTSYRSEFLDLLTLKEELFYNHVENLKVDLDFIPKCYLSSKGLIVIEDLEEKGYQLINEFLDENYVKAVLKILAKLHFQNFGNADELLVEGFFSTNSLIECIKIGICALIDETNVGLKVMSKEKFKEQFLLELKEVLKLFNENNSYRKCLCHGNLYINNILYFKDNENVRCKLINFEMTRFAPPLHDVTFLLIHNASKDDIKNNHINLLNYYYECLKMEANLNDFNINNFMTYKEFLVTSNIFTNAAKITRLLCFTFLAADKLRSSLEITKPLDKIMHECRFITNAINSTERFRNEFIEQISALEIMFIHKNLNKEVASHIIANTLHSTSFKIENFFVNKNILHVYFKYSSKSLIKTFYIKKISQYCCSELYDFYVLPSACYYLPEQFLILENLCEQNYYENQSRVYLGLDELMIVVKTLAKLHAQGFGYKFCSNALNSPSKLKRMKFNIFLNTIKKLEHKFSNIIQTPKFTNFIDKVFNIFDNFEPKIQTLCHRDLNSTHILLKYNNNQPVDCKFVGTASFGFDNPAHDFMLLVHYNTTNTFKKYFLPDIQAVYYKEIVTVFKDYLTFNQFLEDCIFYNAYTCFKAASNQTFAFIDEKAQYFSSEEESENLKDQLMNDTITHDPIYRERLLELFTSVLEIFNAQVV